MFKIYTLVRNNITGTTHRAEITHYDTDNGEVLGLIQVHYMKPIPVNLSTKTGQETGCSKAESTWTLLVHKRGACNIKLVEDTEFTEIEATFKAAKKKARADRKAAKLAKAKQDATFEPTNAVPSADGSSIVDAKKEMLANFKPDEDPSKDTTTVIRRNKKGT